MTVIRSRWSSSIIRMAEEIKTADLGSSPSAVSKTRSFWPSVLRWIPTSTDHIIAAEKRLLSLIKCILDGKFQQAMGTAIECRRLNKLEEAIQIKVIWLIVEVFQKLSSPDYLNICQRLMFLDEPEDLASILEKLLRSENKDDALLAFQHN